jgi:hypothetical protein
MQCLTDTGTGFVLTNPQPVEYTACTYILVNPTEISSEIFNLTAAQGGLIGGAIVLVWAVAFAYRAAIQALQTNEREYENE